MSEDRALAHFEKLFGPEFGHGRAFDLAPLRQALAALGDPHEKLPPVVHVAGTNGKGSTIAFLRAIAEARGERVHAFTKPQLLYLRERFGFDDNALIAAADRVKAKGADISQFEAHVAVAFLLFSETPADLVLLETGFGGRDDATNVITRPALTVLTPIDLDHQAILGATRAQIAAHKAGIIKRGAPVISARAHEEVLPVLEDAAARAETALLLGGRAWDAYARNGSLIVQTEDCVLDLPKPSLFGAHQIENAGLAAVAAMQLGFDEDAIAHGITHALWPGRLQPLTRGGLAERVIAAGGELWIDGGHNPHAAAALAQTLQQMQPRQTIAIVGMRARKDSDAFVDALAPAITQLIALPLAGDVSAEPAAMCARARKNGIRARAAETLGAALEAALETPAPRILICGSLLLAGQALQANGA